MSMILPEGLPAIETLAREGLDINLSGTYRIESDGSTTTPAPQKETLRIAVLNLMPIKETTEADFVRVLSSSVHNLRLDFMKIKSHVSKHASVQHMTRFYRDADVMMREHYDGLIITGAPLEMMPFEDVTYWRELQSIFNWARQNVRSTLYICWAAQAGLYHFYGVGKYITDDKVFGIFSHTPLQQHLPLFRGFDDDFFAPHSRHTTILRKDIEQAAAQPAHTADALSIISESSEAGVHIVMARNGGEFFITGHSEYAPETLDGEYKRDVAKNLPIKVPLHYYRDDNPALGPLVRWRGHAHLLFNNWLNYYVAK